MKIMLFAVGATMSLSVFGVTYASEGEGMSPNSQFTQVAGVVAQAPTQSARPIGRVDIGASPQYFFAKSQRGTWLFSADATDGGS